MKIGSAYSLRQECELGSLEPGKLADLIILSDNPLAVSPDAIPEIQGLMTMVGGQAEVCAAEYEEYCD